MAKIGHQRRAKKELLIVHKMYQFQCTDLTSRGRDGQGDARDALSALQSLIVTILIVTTMYGRKQRFAFKQQLEQPKESFHVFLSLLADLQQLNNLNTAREITTSELWLS